MHAWALNRRATCLFPPGWTREALRALTLALTLLVLSPAARADVLDLRTLPQGPLGRYTAVLQETDGTPGLEQVLRQQEAFRPAGRDMLSFGIGAAPVWLRLEASNAGTQPLTLQLIAGVTWLDRIDAYLVQANRQVARHWTGDTVAGTPGASAALGYVLPLTFPPGHSTLYLRVETPDPMLVPLALETDRGVGDRKQFFGYFYGFLYGYLGALCLYNLLLFAGMGERSYLYYSLTLLSFIACNLAYTGHGLVHLWPGMLELQRYVILVWMVVFSSCGLMFASRFLALAEHAPRLLRGVQAFAALGIVALVLSVLAGSQLAAAYSAFVYVSLFTVVMFLLGILALREGRTAGRYFLAATTAGLLGVGTTALAVWGKIPATALTYHATEIGFVIDSTLLAMALSYQIRQYQQANQIAESMAREDPLTGLYNRRAFMELAAPGWSSAGRGERPMSLIMMDLDHFKQINDRHGHQAGDAVLVEIGALLKRRSRASDIVARWGGEEFILLLAETDQAQAVIYAERLRQEICGIVIPGPQGDILLSASFGVAERAGEKSLEDMIRHADVCLYQAKHDGRNRVCFDPCPEVFTDAA